MASSPILNLDVRSDKHRVESSQQNFVGRGLARTGLKSFFLISFKSLAANCALLDITGDRGQIIGMYKI